MKPRLLDLFCGAGGAAMGYARAGFEVVGVDLAPQPRYPFEFHQADALTFALDGFDAIHASPVCKGYSALNAVNKREHPRLIPVVRERLIASGKPWIIENVERASFPSFVKLCGSMFGLRVWRHRRFESNVLLFAPGHCNHAIKPIGVYGASIWDSSQRGSLRSDKYHAGEFRPAIVSFEIACQAMGIDWMAHDELTQAIPPAYTEWLGRQLLAALKSEVA